VTEKKYCFLGFWSFY